jgi:hypothetical protein
MESATLRLPSRGPDVGDTTGDWAYVPAYLRRAPCYLEIMIPALDEARRLPHALMRMIRYLEEQPYQSSLVVIDNGSVERTGDLVGRLGSDAVPAHVIGCAQPGKGAAVRRGIQTSRAHFLGPPLRPGACHPDRGDRLPAILPVVAGAVRRPAGRPHRAGSARPTPAQPGPPAGDDRRVLRSHRAGSARQRFRRRPGDRARGVAGALATPPPRRRDPRGAVHGPPRSGRWRARGDCGGGRGPPGGRPAGPPACLPCPNEGTFCPAGPGARRRE